MVSDNALKVLKAYYEHADEDYVYRYSWIEDHTDLSRKDAEKAVRELRAAGYLEYVKGLFDEDGQVAGSGHAIAQGRRRDIKAKLDELGVQYDV